MATQARRKTATKTKAPVVRNTTKRPASTTKTKPKRSSFSNTKKIVKAEKKQIQPVVSTSASNELVSIDAATVTQWSLIAIGELYLMTIVFALVVLGILYWATAMTNIVQALHLFGI